MKIEDAAFEPIRKVEPVVKPYTITHGTMECHNIKETRKFLEEFLGLEVVRHAPPRNDDAVRDEVPHRVHRDG